MDWRRPVSRLRRTLPGHLLGPIPLVHLSGHCRAALPGRHALSALLATTKSRADTRLTAAVKISVGFATLTSRAFLRPKEAPAGCLRRPAPRVPTAPAKSRCRTSEPPLSGSCASRIRRPRSRSNPSREFPAHRGAGLPNPSHSCLAWHRLLSRARRDLPRRTRRSVNCFQRALRVLHQGVGRFSRNVWWPVWGWLVMTYWLP